MPRTGGAYETYFGWGKDIQKTGEGRVEFQLRGPTGKIIRIRMDKRDAEFLLGVINYDAPVGSHPLRE